MSQTLHPKLRGAKKTSGIPRKAPRDWPTRWRLAWESTRFAPGVYASPNLNRYVALKNHPIWQAIGSGAGGFSDTLGNPWPPFAFNSGMGWIDVSRAEAEKLKLLGPDDPPPRADRTWRDINHLDYNPARLDADLRDAIRQFPGIRHTPSGRLAPVPADPPTPPPSLLSTKPQPVPPSSQPAPRPRSLFQRAADAVRNLISPSGPPAKNLDELLAVLKLDKRQPGQWSPKDATAIWDALRKPAEQRVKASTIISAVEGHGVRGFYTRRELRKDFQEVLNRLPKSVIDALPKVTFRFNNADYDIGEGGHVGNINTPRSRSSLIHLGIRYIRGYDPKEAHTQLRTALLHESMHWVHRRLPGQKGIRYRRAVKKLFNQRTTGHAIEQLIGFSQDTLGIPDDFYDLYAGRIYGVELPDEAGLELPPMYTELFASPDKLALLLNRNPDNMLEILRVVLRPFFLD